MNHTDAVDADDIGANLAESHAFVLDADSCITMGKTLEGGHSQLSEVLSLAPSAYMHETVHDEVQRGTTSEKQHLSDLIEQGLICVLTDRDLLVRLKDTNGSEGTACRLVQKSLQEILGHMNNKEGRALAEFYSPIIDLTKTYASIEELLHMFQQIESRMPNDTSAGEVKTILLTEILIFFGVRVTLFVSNDKRARSLAVTATGGQVITSSDVGTFQIFKEAGYSREDVQPFLEKLGPDKRLKAKTPNNEFYSESYQQLVDDLYADKAYLTTDGYIKYNQQL